MTPCLRLITCTGADHYPGYIARALHSLVAKSCFATANISERLSLVSLPVYYLDWSSPLTVCYLPYWPRLLIDYSLCLPPASTHCSVSVYASALSTLPLILLYDHCLSDFFYCVNKAANGSPRHWPFVTEDFARNRSSSVLPIHHGGVCPSIGTGLTSATARSTYLAHGGVQALQLSPSAMNPPMHNPPPPAPVTASPRLAFPEKFDGSPSRCKGFLLQCSMFVNQQPTLYSTDENRIAFVCSLLTGRALEWATAVWSDERTVFPSFTRFLQRFREVFEHPAGGKEVGEQLLALRQGRSTAADYALSFRTLSAQTGGQMIRLNSSSVRDSVWNCSQSWHAAMRDDL